MRGCADPRDDEFLARLVACTPSKVLVSTRLIPQAFANRQGDLMRGVRSIDLGGLRAEDALALMNELGVHWCAGSHDPVHGAVRQSQPAAGDHRRAHCQLPA